MMGSFRIAITVAAVVGFLTVVASCAATIGTNEPDNEVALSDKFDASLRVAMANRSDADTLAILIELDAEAGGDVADRLATLGFTLESAVGQIRIGRATVGAIRQIAAQSEVRSISLSQERQIN